MKIWGGPNGNQEYCKAKGVTRVYSVEFIVKTFLTLRATNQVSLLQLAVLLPGTLVSLLECFNIPFAIFTLFHLFRSNF